jgi:hypothetical protein
VSKAIANASSGSGAGASGSGRRSGSVVMATSYGQPPE